MKLFLIVFVIQLCRVLTIEVKHQSFLQMQARSMISNKEEVSQKDQLELSQKEQSELSQKEWSFINLKLKKKNPKRYGKDGRKCASVFVVSGVMYKDCTNTKSPDGKNTQKEWCYIDPREGGSPNWQYCAAILDYDKVRKKAKQLIEAYIPDIRKVTEVVQAQQGPTAKIEGDYEGIAKVQLVLDVQTQVGEKQMGQLQEKYNQLVTMRKQWEDWELQIKKLKGEIEELKKLNMEESVANCEGLLGYEQENPGDGMIGEYYNNEDFVGTAVVQEDPGVNFEWGGQAPLKGIFPDNFSVRWTTYLKVPVTGTYYFRAMSDDGCAVYLNGRLMLRHFMGSTNGPRDMVEEGQEVDRDTLSHLQSNKGNYEEGMNQETTRKSSSTSQGVQLVSNVKYKLTLLYFHSIHNQFKEDGLNYFKLFWSSDLFAEKLIHQDYFYQTPKQPPLKMYGYHSDWLQLYSLNDFDNAFIDTDQYKQSDIPQQFQGLTQLKLPNLYKESSIKLMANNPVVLFIATNMLQPNPLPEEFKEVGEVMSLLKVSKFSLPENNKVRASGSEPMKIYSRAFAKGAVEVDLKVVEGKASLYTLIMFYMLNPTSPSPLSCGGTEIEVSATSGPAFASCKASSVLDGGEYNCEYAFTGQMIDAPFKTWSSNGEGIGAWIEIELKQEYQLTRILYKNREKSIQRSRELHIVFGNGVSLVHQVKNTDSVQKISFEPQIVRSVKVIIKSVYTSFNNGGSFQIMGLPCIDPLAKQDTPEEGENQLVELKCKDNMVNNKLLEKRNYIAGDQFDAVCLESCAENMDVQVFGDMVYAEDSSLCKSSEHMGVNSKVGKVFKVVVERFRTLYEGASRNGIQSQGKATTDGSKSVSFEGKKDLGLEELDNMEVGFKVDFYINKQKKWVAGQVVELDRRAIDLLFITVALDGYAAEFNENVQFPQPAKVDYCGNQISGREDCDEKSKDKKKQKDKAIKVCFGAGKDCGVKGYLLDAGQKKKKEEESGLVFGWERDISSQVRTRGVSQDPLLDNLVLFPADAKSQWCLGADTSSKVPCLPAKWSVDVPNGKYDVKVTAGDPAFSEAISININDQVLIDAQVLRRNQYFTKTITVQVSNKVITIDGICKAKDCKHVWSRMNTVEITKNMSPGPPGPIADTSGPIKLGCGNAFAGQACTDGQQVENCVFDSIAQKGVKNCANRFKLVLIPKFYECKDQRDKYKCIKNEFKDADHCKKNCPGKCKNEVCSVRAQ